ncbi:glycosyltransferase [Weeksellaceae bacterium A-14]
MMDKKTVTVVISSYKYGHLAAHCIESILSQTRRPDKILFVDDGVGDCVHLKKLYPMIDFTFRKKNLGVVANFDDMLRKVKTDYCMFLGADNWLRSDTFEILLKKDEDIVTYDIIVTGELKDDVKVRHPDQIKNINGDYYWDRSSGHHGSMMYKTKLAQKFGYKKNPDSKYSEEDKMLWNNLTENRATVAHIAEGLLYYRRHKENFNNYFPTKHKSKPLKSIFIRILGRISKLVKH